MAAHPLSEEVCQQTLDAVAQYGSVTAAARALGINLSTFKSRVALARGVSQTPRRVDSIPERLHLHIENGVVIVFSDAHYYPEVVTTAHRALVRAICELRPRGVIANGDLLDGASISRHPRTEWEPRPTVKQELDTVKARLDEVEDAMAGYGWRVWLRGNHDCLTPDTEALTRRGWLKHDQIQVGDEILSYDASSGGVQWEPVQAVVRRQHDGDVLVREGAGLSFSVTPNHRMMGRTPFAEKSGKGYGYTVASDLPGRYQIPVAAKVCNQLDYDLSDDEIRLAAWMLTDSHHTDRGYVIFYQSGESASRIRDLLSRMGVDCRERARERQVSQICGRPVSSVQISYEFHLPTQSSKRWRDRLDVFGHDALPAWVTKLSERQFGVLLDEMVFCDGTEFTHCRWVYKSKGLLDALQCVLPLFGWHGILKEYRPGQFYLSLNKRCQQDIMQKPRREHYVGTVWCLTVPSGNFFIRRNGKTHFTGNCRFATHLSGNAPQYEGVPGFALRDHFPTWQHAMRLDLNPGEDSHTIVKHRAKGGVHAAHNNSKDAGVNFVTGHLHALKVTPWNNARGTYFGVDTGTLADTTGPHAGYLEDGVTQWRSGFAILTFRHGRLLTPEVVRVIAEGVVEFRGKEYEV